VSYVFINAGGFLGVAKHDVAILVSQLTQVDGKSVLAISKTCVVQAQRLVIEEDVDADKPAARERFCRGGNWRLADSSEQSRITQVDPKPLSWAGIEDSSPFIARPTGHMTTESSNRACMSSALPMQPNGRNMKLGACPGWRRLL
jgi:hypothetical protein